LWQFVQFATKTETNVEDFIVGTSIEAKFMSLFDVIGGDTSIRVYFTDKYNTFSFVKIN
jgi:hypothetical protein